MRETAVNHLGFESLAIVSHYLQHLFIAAARRSRFFLFYDPLLSRLHARNRKRAFVTEFRSVSERASERACIYYVKPPGHFDIRVARWWWLVTPLLLIIAEEYLYNARALLLSARVLHECGKSYTYNKRHLLLKGNYIFIPLYMENLCQKYSK